MMARRRSDRLPLAEGSQGLQEGRPLAEAICDRVEEVLADLLQRPDPVAEVLRDLGGPRDLIAEGLRVSDEAGQRKSNAGRPVKPIDLALVERLAELFCTDVEIARALDIDPATLYRRIKRSRTFATDYARVKERGQNAAKASLRNRMWQAAQAGNVTMMIWLSKQVLGMRDRHEIEVPTSSLPGMSPRDDYSPEDLGVVLVELDRAGALAALLDLGGLPDRFSLGRP